MNPAPRAVPSEDRHQVIVIVGQPDLTLVAGLRTLGFSAVAEDEKVVVWSRLLPLAAYSAAAPPAAAPDDPADGSRLLMTIVDAANALGVGRSTVYELIGQGQLEVVHIGRSARIRADAVRDLVERLRGASRHRLAS